MRERDPGVYALTEALGLQVGDFIEALRLQEERTQAREQLEAILRGVADAVTAQAPDGRLLFANEAAARSMGFETPQELMDAPITAIMDRYEIIDDRGDPFPLEALPGRRALGGEDNAETVVRFRVRDTGEERWSAVKAAPIRDHDGNVVMAINVIEDITTHKRAELAQRFLARSAEVLASSLDPDQLLVEIANLAVPELADWCSVEVQTDGGLLERKALAHVNPDVRQRAIDLARRYPPDPDAPQGVYKVVSTGQPELYPDIPDEMLRAAAVDEEHYNEIVAIGMRSAIVVPMTTRGRTLGALTWVNGPRDAGSTSRTWSSPRSSRAGAPPPSTTLGSTATAPTSRARSSRACCRSSCPTSLASRPPRASAPPARATRWAATSTTCSRPATAAGRS